MNLERIYERWEKKTLARGEAEGRVKGKAEAVLAVLESRGSPRPPRSAGRSSSAPTARSSTPGCGRRSPPPASRRCWRARRPLDPARSGGDKAPPGRSLPGGAASPFLSLPGRGGTFAPGARAGPCPRGNAGRSGSADRADERGRALVREHLHASLREAIRVAGVILVVVGEERPPDARVPREAQERVALAPDAGVHQRVPGGVAVDGGARGRSTLAPCARPRATRSGSPRSARRRAGAPATRGDRAGDRAASSRRAGPRGDARSPRLGSSSAPTDHRRTVLCRRIDEDRFASRAEATRPGITAGVAIPAFTSAAPKSALFFASRCSGSAWPARRAWRRSPRAGRRGARARRPAD